MKDRLPTLRGKLDEAACDAFVSISPPANQYLTGFRGSTSGVIVTAEQALFLCDFRYIEQAGGQVRDFEIRKVSGSLPARLGEQLSDTGVHAAAFEPESMSVDEMLRIQETFPGTLKPVPDMVSAMRRVKSEEEIDSIRAASQLAEGVLMDLLTTLEAGLPERELAARFEYEFKKRGASGASFDMIALFGSRTSLPHGEPGDKALEPGDVVLLDFGCRLNGYCSDLTRTYAFGSIPGDWLEDIYHLILAAQEKALEVLCPGMRGRELDAVARDLIAGAGHGEHFGHGLGHGVGIEIHEGPRLNPESEIILEEGMVVTIEPGVYLPGRGGVRTEDLVVIRRDGCEVLSGAPKELQVLGL